MASFLLPLLAPVSPSPRLLSSSRSYFLLASQTLPLLPRCPRVAHRVLVSPPRALPDTAVGAAEALRGALADAFLASPPTWRSAAVSNLAVFVAASPLLLSGLSASGFAAAYLLGTLTWRAFGHKGLILVAAYFVAGTAATKLKIKQKEALGVAEKRGGRRGPGSVIGSSAAGCVCALLSIYNVGGSALAKLWILGFVASFCTKLSDTVSSEIGKAYGRTTYLVTTFKVVPRGTEGAISIEGTLAGILASILLANVGYLLGQLNNDVVNVLNISAGGILAVLMQQLLVSWRS
uniref:TIGR00297 family protein n=1 Tax=Leersia perrieri TaxID=77586 RepID=A0A0D9V588_9ORYZ